MEKTVFPVNKELVSLPKGVIEIYHINKNTSSTPHIFLHGWGISPKSYMVALNKLSEKIGYIIAPTLPGFGDSTALQNPLNNTQNRTASIIVDSLHQVLPSSSPLPFIGHSLGGGLAITIAKENPGMVSKLDLITPIGGSKTSIASWPKIFSSLRHEVGIDSVPRMLDALPSFFANPIPLVALGITARHTNLVESLETVLLREIPVHLILADDDEVVPAEKYRKIPSLHITEVHGTHGWILSHPEECANILFPVI